MDKHPFSTAGTPSDQAIEWLARLRADDVTPQETAEFATWLDTSRANKVAFDEATELWHLLGNLPRQSIPRVKPKAHYHWALPLSAAASFLFACVLLVMQLATPAYETGKGEQRRVVLADGSTAFMNTASRMVVDYSSEQRRIRVFAGEVWFDVVKDSQRPFIVAGQYASARAVGTAFTVRETPGFTRVGVSEGVVELRAQSAAAPHRLMAGQQGTVSQNLTDYGSYDASTRLAWQRGQLVYDEVRLSDLIEDLNRYLPNAMSVNDVELGERRVTAVLYLDDQEAMLEALGKALPIRWKSVSDSLIIITADG